MRNLLLMFTIISLALFSFTAEVAAKRPESRPMWVSQFEMAPVETQIGMDMVGQIKINSEYPGQAGIKGVAGAVIVAHLIDPAGEYTVLEIRTRGHGIATFRKEIPGPGPYQFEIISISKSNLLYDDSFNEVAIDDFSILLQPPPAVYWTGQANGVINQSTQDGVFIRSWVAQQVAGLDPWVGSIAVDSLGYVYVATVGEHVNGCAIQKFTSYGDLVVSWDGICAISIAIGNGDDVYLLDIVGGNSRIRVFSSAGTLLRWWWAGEGHRIALDSQDNVYVLNWDVEAEYLVQVFDKQGVSLAEWGIIGPDADELDDPFDIAVDSVNNIYIIERGGNWHRSVKIFTPLGGYVNHWDYGPTNGVLLDVIAIDFQDRLYVSGPFPYGNTQIRKYSINGALIDTWGPPGGSTTGVNGITVYR